MVWLRKGKKILSLLNPRQKMFQCNSIMTKKCWTRCADDTKRLGSMASLMGVELERVIFMLINIGFISKFQQNEVLWKMKAKCILI